jgi:uncharacterized protein YjiS (DUF1127 family)
MPPYVRAPLQDHSVVGEIAARLHAALAHAILVLLRWHELARQRRTLAAMDDHVLKDIGLTRVDAHREARRPFWDDGDEPWRNSR